MSTDYFTERFTYPKPVKPQAVRDLDALHRQFDRGMRIKDNLTGLTVATRALLAEMEYAQALTDAERAEVEAYNRQVDEYNRQVDAYNARVKAWREAQQAKRETAALRKATCGKCFTVHGKGQTECW